MWPVLLAAGGAGLSGLSTYYQIKQANELASQKAQAIDRDRQVRLKTLTQKREQLKDSISLTLEQRKRQQMREESTLRASFGASGVTGNTPLRQLYTSQLQSEYDNNINKKNLNTALDQTYLEELSVNIGVDSSIASAKASQTPGWASALMIGGSAFQSGVSGYLTGKQI
jgi:hypothetical protein